MPNAQRPNDDTRAQRVLSQLGKEGGDLTTAALKELKAVPADRDFQLAGAAGRDLDAIVAHFGKLWDALVRNGKISRRPPTNKLPDGTTLFAEWPFAEDVQQQVLSTETLRNELPDAPRWNHTRGSGSRNVVRYVLGRYR